jgi:hypothetical protein
MCISNFLDFAMLTNEKFYSYSLCMLAVAFVQGSVSGRVIYVNIVTRCVHLNFFFCNFPPSFNFILVGLDSSDRILTTFPVLL